MMSYDCYAAVCHPLHYAFLMSPRLCHILASLAWLSGVATTLKQSPLILRLSFCSHHHVDHFPC